MNPSVTVWVKPSCVQCTQVKRMLERLAVPYETLDLTDPAYATQLERFISEGFKSAPITTFRDTTIAGFDPDALKALAEAYWNNEGDAA